MNESCKNCIASCGLRNHPNSSICSRYACAADSTEDIAGPPWVKRPGMKAQIPHKGKPTGIPLFPKKLYASMTGRPCGCCGKHFGFHTKNHKVIVSNDPKKLIDPNNVVEFGIIDIDDFIK